MNKRTIDKRITTYHYEDEVFAQTDYPAYFVEVGGAAAINGENYRVVEIRTDYTADPPTRQVEVVKVSKEANDYLMWLRYRQVQEVVKLTRLLAEEK